MRRTLWTVAYTGLLAVCITSCGGRGSSGAKNYPADVCNRLQTCGDLSVVGASTLAECTASANQQLNQASSSQRPAVVQALNQCLALSDCASFVSCIQGL